jgi:ABC-type nitrate/sulfonate/bicarbonate transport system permease component
MVEHTTALTHTPVHFHIPGGRLLLRAFLPIALLVLWFGLSLNWPADPRYATPVGVMRAFGDLWNRGELQTGVLISLRHILLAFVLAVGLGGTLGLAMGYSQVMGEWLGPFFHSLRPIAPYAWIPLVILWFGIGDMAVISIVTYAAFFPMLVNAINGARKLDRRMIEAAQVLGAKRLTLFTRVFLPATLPSLLVGARLAMGSAWIAVVAAEIASSSRGGRGASGGLGQMMYHFYAYSINLNDIVACTIAVGMLALLSDRAVALIYGRLTPWANR